MPKAFLLFAWFIGVIAHPAIAGEVVKVKIDGLAFLPADITVHTGDTIEWANADFVDHTATDKDGRWDVAIAAGQSARMVATTVGLFDYYCRFHPHMTGTVRVVQD